MSIALAWWDGVYGQQSWSCGRTRVHTARGTLTGVHGHGWGS